jgi:dTDP-glucose 4,6-dehydratase
MSRKNILITGGYGFIGSNFITYFLEKYPEYNIVNIDKMTYAADKLNLSKEDSADQRYTFIEGDICDSQLVKKLFQEHKFQGVIHFAAESHVDNSINSPGQFITTNINGTFELINTAYQTWHDGPFQLKDQFINARFLHISTDEVYGSLGETGLFTEETPYAPNSPYSASKASSDFIVRSYFHTYGLNCVTTNCSNNYGPKQHDEKLIPTIIRNALQNKNIPIYGSGLNIRDWLYVADHCKGIDLAFHQGKNGETYNIGGNNEKTNLDVCNHICDILDELTPKESGKYKSLISYVNDRPGHDFRYAIDANKITNELKWVPDENFKTGMLKTVQWYIKKYNQ